MESHAVATPSIVVDVDHSLDPRVVSLERASGAIVVAVVACVAFVFVTGVSVVAVLEGRMPLLALPAPFAGWALLIGLLAWHAYSWPPIAYRHTSYRLDEHGIEIRRGVWWRAIVNVPRSRVQYTDVSQGPLERRFGLGTLIIYTAGTDHAKVALPGLDHGVALQLRERLLPREGSDAV